MADVTQITKALELYYADNSSYPTIITPGSSLKSPDGLTTYMSNIPSNPTPRNDNGCGNNDYTYSSTPDNTNYSMNFCLGNTTGSTSSGINSVSSSGIGTAPGLVAWWKFDEGTGTTAIDSSGNNNTGTWSGTGTHYVAGKSSAYAGQFNGTDDHVVVSPSSILNAISSSHLFSYCAWIYPTTVGAGDIMGFNGYNPLWSYSFTLNGSKLFITYEGTSSGNWLGVLGTVNISSNQWSHICVTYDGASFIFYINSSASSPNNQSQHTINSNSNFRIGSVGWSRFSGKIDETRLYNRPLSSNEIQAIYNASKD